MGRWDATQIFLDVLFPDVPHWDFRPLAVEDGNAKNPFTQENAFRMVAKSPVTEISKERFRFIEPFLNRQVVFGLAAEPLGTALSMLLRMGHGQNSLVS